MSKLNNNEMFSLMIMLSNFRQDTIDLLKMVESVDLVESYQKEIVAKDGVIFFIDQLTMFVHKDKFEEGFDFSENYDRLKEVFFQFKNTVYKKFEVQEDKLLILNYMNKPLSNYLNEQKQALKIIFDFVEEKLLNKFKQEIQKN